MTADEIRIQYVFADPETGYCDALVLPLDLFVKEYGPLDGLDEKSIAAAKAERVANWQEALAAPAVEPDPAQVKAACEAELEALDDRREVLVAQVAELEAAEPVKGGK